MLIRFMVASSASFSGVSIWTAINFIFLCVPAGFLATLFVSRYYGDTYFHITLVEVIGFLGMMAGGLLISTWGGFKRHTKTLLVGMVSFGLLATLMGSVKNFYMYLVLMAVYEVALTMVQTVSTTLLQENSTPEMSGRVFGLFGAAYSSLLPIDMVVFGLLADKTSMRLLMVMSGGLLILLAVVMFMDKSLQDLFNFYFCSGNELGHCSQRWGRLGKKSLHLRRLPSVGLPPTSSFTIHNAHIIPWKVWYHTRLKTHSWVMNTPPSDTVGVQILPLTRFVSWFCPVCICLVT